MCDVTEVLVEKKLCQRFVGWKIFFRELFVGKILSSQVRWVKKKVVNTDSLAVEKNFIFHLKARLSVYVEKKFWPWSHGCWVENVCCHRKILLVEEMFVVTCLLVDESLWLFGKNFPTQICWIKKTLCHKKTFVAEESKVGVQKSSLSSNHVSQKKTGLLACKKNCRCCIGGKKCLEPKKKALKMNSQIKIEIKKNLN